MLLFLRNFPSCVLLHSVVFTSKQSLDTGKHLLSQCQMSVTLDYITYEMEWRANYYVTQVTGGNV